MVDVTAETLYEASPKRSAERVRTSDFETWLNAAPNSPAEMVLKNRLRELFNR